MKNKAWNIIEKLFDSFPFQFLISCVIGGVVFAFTPKEAPLLVKFGTFWYIVFISLIAFLTIALIVWIYDFIKAKRNKKVANDEALENFRKHLYEITNKWDEEDIKTLRQLVESDNKEIVKIGFAYGQDSLFTSGMLESKLGEMVDTGHNSRMRSTVYWLKEDIYILCKLVLNKYGKLSKFDKGPEEEKDGKDGNAK